MSLRSLLTRIDHQISFPGLLLALVVITYWPAPSLAILGSR